MMSSGSVIPVWQSVVSSESVVIVRWSEVSSWSAVNRGSV